MVPDKLEKRNEVLYAKLVPASGHADTLEGEMLRAINKIVYRYYNDGDYYHKDYGTETAGPAHAFLLNLDYSDGYDSNNKDLLELERALFKILDPDNTYYGKDYEDSLNDALIKILDYIESREKSGYKINKYDMLHSEPLYENYEADEDDQEYDWDYDHQYGDYDDFAKGGDTDDLFSGSDPRRGNVIKSTSFDWYGKALYKLDKLAQENHGEFGFVTLSFDEMQEYIDIDKADKLAFKNYGEFGFGSLRDNQKEDLINKYPEIVKKHAKGGKVKVKKSFKKYYDEKVPVYTIDVGVLNLGNNHREDHFLMALNASNFIDDLDDKINSMDYRGDLIFKYKDKYGNSYSSDYAVSEFYLNDDYAKGGKVKIGDELTMVDKYSPAYGKKGKVTRFIQDGVEVDFGRGDKYGITFRRIKGDEIVYAKGGDIKSLPQQLVDADRDETYGWGSIADTPYIDGDEITIIVHAGDGSVKSYLNKLIKGFGYKTKFEEVSREGNVHYYTWKITKIHAKGGKAAKGKKLLTKEYKDYLDKLRDSGRTNMFGATPYLEEEFGLSYKDAKQVLVEWMRSFAKGGEITEAGDVDYPNELLNYAKGGKINTSNKKILIEHLYEYLGENDHREDLRDILNTLEDEYGYAAEADRENLNKALQNEGIRDEVYNDVIQDYSYIADLDIDGDEAQNIINDIVDMQIEILFLQNDKKLARYTD